MGGNGVTLREPEAGGSGVEERKFGAASRELPPRYSPLLFLEVGRGGDRLPIALDALYLPMRRPALVLPIGMSCSVETGMGSSGVGSATLSFTSNKMSIPSMSKLILEFGGSSPIV